MRIWILCLLAGTLCLSCGRKDSAPGAANSLPGSHVWIAPDTLALPVLDAPGSGLLVTRAEANTRWLIEDSLVVGGMRGPTLWFKVRHEELAGWVSSGRPPVEHAAGKIETH